MPQKSMLVVLVVVAGFCGCPLFAQSPTDRDWECNAILTNAKSFTIPDIGACQGVSLINHKLYFYGDRYDLKPRRGEIHEYTLDMEPTGRRLVLKQGETQLMTHPTGIAYLDKNHVFIGNTVNQQATIFLLDWERAWKEGSLDNAIKNEIKDDLAINGCRPIVVAAFGKRFIATADYGDKKNAVRLYDPERMFKAKLTSETGVLVRRFACGEFNQNLDWHEETGQLVGIQNVVAGLGWRLQFMNLKESVSSSHLDASMKNTIVFPPHTELEGFRVLPNGKFLLVTAHRSNNVWIGNVKRIESVVSKKGHELPFFEK